MRLVVLVSTIIRDLGDRLDESDPQSTSVLFVGEAVSHYMQCIRMKHMRDLSLEFE